MTRLKFLNLIALGADLQSVPDKLTLISTKYYAGEKGLLDIFVIE